MKESERLRLLSSASVGGGAAALFRDRRRGDLLSARDWWSSLRGSPFFVPAIQAVGLLALLLFASPAGKIVSFAATACVADYLLFGRIAERGVRRHRTLVEHLTRLLDGIGGGLVQKLSVEQSLLASVDSIPEGSLRNELEKVRTSIRQGEQFAEAVRRLGAKFNDREVGVAVAAVLGLHQVGGRGIESLSRITRQIRSDQTLIERTERQLRVIHRMFLCGAAAVLFIAIVIRTWAAPWMFERGDPGSWMFEAGVAMVFLAVALFRRLAWRM